MCAKTELGSISKQTEKQFQVYFENTHTPNTTKFTYYGSSGEPSQGKAESVL